jgi:hypothetical protein
MPSVPATALINVVFPAPSSPKKATTSPGTSEDANWDAILCVSSGEWEYMGFIVFLSFFFYLANPLFYIGGKVWDF